MMFQTQRALTMLLLASVALASASIEEKCQGQATCEKEAVRASAMLQVKAEPTKTVPEIALLRPSAPEIHSPGNLLQSVQCAPETLALQASHLLESRDCIAPALQEMHLKAVRRHAALLAAQGQQEASPVKKSNKKEEAGPPPSLEDLTTSPPTTTEKAATEAPIDDTDADTEEPNAEPADPAAPAGEASVGGANAPLDESGFQATTKLCCPAETEVFFNRLLDSMGFDVCSKPHIQGLMHWFTCVPDMAFQYMLDTINNGNPCKYWTKRGDECPVLTPECAGHFCR